MAVLTASYLSRVLWYHKTESGRLVPGELSLDAPVVLGGKNGAGKTTYLRLLPFLLGVPSTAALRPSQQLQSFAEFYLQDALLLAEFVDRHPHTYLFAGTSRGIQVLALQVPLRAVRERVDTLLRQRGTISALLSQLRKEFVGRTQEMGYGEYAKSRSYQGSLLHALLQERVSLRQVSEILGRFFDEKHQVTLGINKLRESLERGLDLAERIGELHGLLQDFPKLEEDLGGLLRKAGEVISAQDRLEALLQEGQAQARSLEEGIRQGQDRLRALQERKAPLGDREVLEGEDRSLEQEILELQAERRTRQEDARAVLAPLWGDRPRGVRAPASPEGDRPLPATPEGVAALLQELPLQEALGELARVQESLARLRYSAPQEELSRGEGRLRELKERARIVEQALSELAGSSSAPLPPPTSDGLEGVWEECRDLLREGPRLAEEAGLVALAALEAWKDPLQPPPEALQRYPELPQLVQTLARQQRQEAALARLEGWQRGAERRLAALREEAAQARRDRQSLEATLASLRQEQGRGERERDQAAAERDRLERPDTLLAYLKSLEVPDWTALARPLRSELLSRSDLTPRFLGEGGLMLDAERIEWEDPLSSLEGRIQDLEARLDSLAARIQEAEGERAALAERLGRLEEECRRAEERLGRAQQKAAALSAGLVREPHQALERLHREALLAAGRAGEQLARRRERRARLEALLPGLLAGLRREEAALEGRLALLLSQVPALRQLEAEQGQLEARVKELQRAQEALERWGGFLQQKGPRLAELSQKREALRTRLEALRRLEEEEKEVQKALHGLEGAHKGVQAALGNLEERRLDLEGPGRALRALLAEEGDDPLPGRAAPVHPEAFLAEAGELLEGLRRGLARERTSLEESLRSYLNRKGLLQEKLGRLLGRAGLPAALSGLQRMARQGMDSLLEAHQLAALEKQMEELHLHYREGLSSLKQAFQARGVLPIRLANFEFTRVGVNLDLEMQKAERIEEWTIRYRKAAEGLARETPLFAPGESRLAALEHYRKEAHGFRQDLEWLLAQGVLNEAAVTLEVQRRGVEGQQTRLTLSGEVRGSTSGGGDLIAAAFVTALALRTLFGKGQEGSLIPLPIEEFARLDKTSSVYVLRELPERMGVLPVVALPDANTARALGAMARAQGLRLRVYEVKDLLIREVRG